MRVMRVVLVMVLVGVAACDAPSVSCNHNHTTDGNDHRCVTLVDASPGDPSDVGYCNVLTQTGCYANEKCTWYFEQTIAPRGYLTCVPVGSKAIGDPCTFIRGANTGYDDCVRGAYCANGTCSPICDLTGGAPGCAGETTCKPIPPAFVVGGMAAAGICER